VIKDRFREEAEGLGVALESTPRAHQAVQGAFPAMTVGRMAQIVSQASRFDEIGIEEKLGVEERRTMVEKGTNGAADLGHFHGMRQAGPVKVVFSGEEDLGLALQGAEGGRVNDPIAIDLKGAAVFLGPAGPGVQGFGIERVVEVIDHSAAR
jgi:hypothetical protein